LITDRRTDFEILDARLIRLPDQLRRHLRRDVSWRRQSAQSRTERLIVFAAVDTTLRHGKRAQSFDRDFIPASDTEPISASIQTIEGRPYGRKAAFRQTNQAGVEFEARLPVHLADLGARYAFT